MDKSIKTKQEIANFLITDTFKITGRGLVFVGYISEGIVSIGDTVEFTALNTLYQRKIIGIEEIRMSQPSNKDTGLLIKCENEAEIDLLKNWKPDNTIAVIYKTEMNETNPTANNSAKTKVKRTWWQKCFGSW